MIVLARRAFLVLVAAIVPARWRDGLAFAQPREIAFADFLRVSSRLTGRARLDEEAGRRYFAAFTASAERRALLEDLVREPAVARTPAHLALEQDIIAAWYTGVYEMNGETRLATHGGALMWSVLGMPAPGVCVSADAPWSRPPSR